LGKGSGTHERKGLLKTNILTFSRLAKWAAWLKDDDKQKFKELKAGTAELGMLDNSIMANGWRVQCMISAHFSQFTLKLVNGEVGRRRKDTIVNIDSLIHKGKLYSRYQFQCSTTKYQPKFFERFMPVFMPYGLNAQRKQNRTTMQVRNADGTLSFSDFWTNGSTGRSGYPNLHIVIDDATGLVLSAAKASEVVADCDYLSSNGEATLGWFPKAVGYETFMKSISDINTARPEWGQVVDASKMQVLANKAIHTALAFVKSVPGAKMRLFPARPLKQHYAHFHSWNHGGDMGKVARLSWDARNGYSHYDITLPEVFVFWREDKENRWQYSTLTIPPIGNPYLDFDDPKTISRFGQVLSGQVGYPKCAYHSVPAFDADKCNPKQQQWPAIYPGGNAKPELMFNFAKKDDHIMVLTLDPRAATTYARWMWVARRPEDALADFQERALIDSLPLA